ncbi:flagellin protein FliC [Clostridium aceticum]|uniref:Flagellin n=1 Tax=Clostridium aceticum TaxID=84022 RepID=A0A0D8I6D8_9CLOT|nr:flagellin [Clostridium aceticum]AKL93775.1 flagellin protein FliC [Clostridium aceticum]KJF25813.1 flagellin [Clostridium aceticum]
MRINNNLMAMNTHRQLGISNNMGSKSMEKLSSGFRINRAGDDAAGLAISEKMRGQIRGLNQASRNAQDSISLIQTAEGALTETHAILQRMRELAVQSSNDTNTEVDRGEIQKEINQLTSEIDRIANTTEFNTQKLLNGDKAGLRDAATGTVTVQSNTSATVTATAASTGALDTSGTIIITRTASGATNLGDDFDLGDPAELSIALNAAGDTLTGFGSDLTLAGLADMQVGESITISIKAADAGNTDATQALTMQIGANSGQTMLIGIDDMRAEALGLRNSGEALDITDSQKATAAITTINNALERVSAERSKLGAYQNRLEHTIKNLDTSSENLQASESRIRDVDMAKEMMEFTKNNILQQAAQAMLAQANQAPQGVLQLLR